MIPNIILQTDFLAHCISIYLISPSVKQKQLMSFTCENRWKLVIRFVHKIWLKLIKIFYCFSTPYESWLRKQWTKNDDLVLTIWIIVCYRHFSTNGKEKTIRNEPKKTERYSWRKMMCRMLYFKSFWNELSIYLCVFQINKYIKGFFGHLLILNIYMYQSSKFKYYYFQFNFFQNLWKRKFYNFTD